MTALAPRRQPRTSRGPRVPQGPGTFHADPAMLITGFICLLMFVPANLTISALGSTGTPAVVVGLFALLWWLVAQANRSSAPHTPAQPVRRTMLWLTIAVLVSYAVAATRPLDGLEQSAADRGLLLLASWLGIVLLASDGLIGIDRLEAPLRMLVLAGGIVAAVGIAQFVTASPIVDVVQIPGLTPNTELTSIYERGGFVRAAGTSTHPIEFGVVLAMILPVALHFALSDTSRSLLLRWGPVGAIALAVPITLSRSAIIGVAVALAIVMPSWSRRARLAGFAGIAALVLFVYVAIPGILGTMSRLFTDISTDGSALSRTDSYALAWDFIQRSPLFGRGLLTFLPQYRIVDNQYLLLLIELGIMGTVAILLVFIVAIGAAMNSHRKSPDPRTRGLAQSLAAMVAAGAISFATFDAFSFPQASGLVFLAIGLIGALSNTARQATFGIEFDRGLQGH